MCVRRPKKQVNFFSMAFSELKDERRTIKGNLNYPIEEVLFQIVFQILDEPAYDFLRTKEQLGYLAYATAWNFRDIQGGGFLIQSNKK